MSSDTASPTARPTLRAIGASIVFVVLGLALTTLLTVGWALAVHGDLLGGLEQLERPGAQPLLVNGLAQLLGFGLATWLVAFRYLHLTPQDLRWCRPRDGVRGLGWGLALGIVPAAAALLLSVPAGGASWVPDTGNLGDYALKVGGTTLALLPAALSEEVAFRGLPLVLMARLLGRVPAIVGLSLVFALAHSFNPNATATPLGLPNIALAGVLLSLAFYAPGGIWTACGAHLGWNATLAALDAPVSGLPFRIPFIDYHTGGPPWLTGGSFGPEGGLTATVALALGTAVAARWSRRGRG